MKINRRQFNQALLAGAGSFFLPAALKLNIPEKPPVVFTRSPVFKRKNHDLSSTGVFDLLNRMLEMMTGKKDPEKAWKSIFSPTERIGIKVSCLPGPALSSTPGLVEAVVSGLEMAGIPKKSIIIWERSNRELTKARFQISEKGPMIYGTDHLPAGGYSDRIEISGQVGTCFSRIVEYVDALINIPVLKDHDIAGVSIAMKNFYGAIHNPNKFHQNCCDPYVADLNNHPYIKKKQRLIIVDCSRIQIHNGPAYDPRYAVEYGGCLLGQDPVAIDAIGWNIIEKERLKMKLITLAGENRRPTYIHTAGQYGLGQDEPKQIDLRELCL